MNQEELKKILPHRDNMLLLDEAFLDGEYAVGRLKITGDEWFLKGHFPDNPVVPGVIQCEILAQSCCVLLADKMSDNITPMYTGLNNVRFKSPVYPGDIFETKVHLTRVKHPFYFAEGQGFVNGKLAIKAEFSFALVEKK